MPEKDAGLWQSLYDSLPPVLPWIFTLFLSGFATIAQYAQKVRTGEVFSMQALILDAVVCIFVGVVTHMLCELAGITGYGRSALVAISAHMGTRAMLIYERWRDRVIGFGADQ